MSKIEIHIIAYNEEIMLPFTIAHYKRMFGDPMIIVHDNFSTDKTVEIAEREGCLVIRFATEGMNDTIQSMIKSQAAMSAQSDWVLCIDADEECLINTKDLEQLDADGINIVEFQGWNIFDNVSSPWDIKVPRGVPCTGYSKPVLIRNHVFKSISFAAGAHSVIVGAKDGLGAKWSKDTYKLLHYKHWSSDWNINRSAELGARQSNDNKARGHSFHFGFAKNIHEEYFNSNFAQRVVIVDSHIEYPEGMHHIDLRPSDIGEILIADKNKLTE